MVDFSPSEFSRVRLQFAQDRSRQGFVDNQFLLQYQIEPRRARRAQRTEPARFEDTAMTTIASLPPSLAAARAAGRLRAARPRRAQGASPASPNGARWRRSSAATSSTSRVATNAMQDPHQIQAKPSLISRARNADLVVCTGAELEIGWLPVLLQQSGNAKVQPGQPGNFAAADFVRKLDVPEQVDRAQGDVHAARQPAHPDRPAQHRARRDGARRAARARSIRRMPAQYAKRRPTSRRRGSRHRALGRAGRAAEGRRRRRRTTRPSSTCTTGWA